MAYAWNFQESLPSVVAIQDLPVKYAMKLAVSREISTTSIRANANLVRDAMRTISCNLGQNALVKLHLTTCVLQSKSANQENL
jgi:hypothetical protein